MRWFASVLLLLAACASACDGGSPPRSRPDAGRTGVRTVKPPPDNRTHVYPPHAIRADGVGPYLLDASLADVLHAAPEGPRYEQLELGDLMSWFLVRAENGRLLIGADERSRRVAFIVVLAASVARTDGGMTVGMSGAALLAAFGPAREPRDVVRSRKVYEFERLPNVQFLTNDAPDRPDEEAHVVAVLVSRPQTQAPPPGKPGPGARPSPASHPAGGKLAPGQTAAAAREAARAAPCHGGAVLAKVPPAELWAAAHVRRPPTPAAAPPASLHVLFGCVTQAEPEALVRAGDELVIVGGAPGKLKKQYALPIAAAEQVAPLDVDGDGRDEIVALSLVRDDDALALSLRTWSWEGGRLQPLAPQRLFEVSREAASTAGVTPAGIDLWTEVRPASGGLVVSGLYVEHTMGGVRVVAPLSPVSVRLEARRAGSPPAEAIDAGPGSSMAPRPDAAPGRPDAGAAPAPAREGEGGKDGKEDPQP